MTETQRINTANVAWQPSPLPGIDSKPLGTDVGAARFDVELARLTPGSALACNANQGLEVLVTTGQVELDGQTLEAGAFARLGAQCSHEIRAQSEAVLLVRQGPIDGADAHVVHMTADAWQQGQGNLTVLPLHSEGGEGTALVHWPKGERFQPHRHFGGEEIYVLSGTFEDEHGRYPTGTWMMSPHMSEHHPFVREETIILVKTGHAPPA